MEHKKTKYVEIEKKNNLLCTWKNHDFLIMRYERDMTILLHIIFLKHKICIQNEGRQYIAMDSALILYTKNANVHTIYDLLLFKVDSCCSKTEGYHLPLEKKNDPYKT